MKATILLFALANALFAAGMFSKIGDNLALTMRPDPVSARKTYIIVGSFLAMNAVLFLACFPHV